MNKKVERTISADLEARELATGVWQLSSRSGGGTEIILRTADPEALAALAGARASAAMIAWERAGATVTLAVAGGMKRIRASTAIVHEPMATLYEALPLVKLDAAARRFWRRVFVLVRIPGGRRLLGLVARRAGGPR